MKNPPSFVMYVVLVKPTGSKTFDPAWSEWAESVHGRFAYGFAKKRDAEKACKGFRVRYDSLEGRRRGKWRAMLII